MAKTETRKPDGGQSLSFPEIKRLLSNEGLSEVDSAVPAVKQEHPVVADSQMAMVESRRGDSEKATPIAEDTAFSEAEFMDSVLTAFRRYPPDLRRRIAAELFHDLGPAGQQSVLKDLRERVKAASAKNTGGLSRPKTVAEPEKVEGEAKVDAPRVVSRSPAPSTTTSYDLPRGFDGEEITGGRWYRELLSILRPGRRIQIHSESGVIGVWRGIGGDFEQYWPGDLDAAPYVNISLVPDADSLLVRVKPRSRSPAQDYATTSLIGRQWLSLYHYLRVTAKLPEGSESNNLHDVQRGIELRKYRIELAKARETER